MNIFSRERMKGVILVSAGLFILGLLSTSAQALRTYNASKSNTASLAAPLEPGVTRNILTEIDRVGVAINEKGIQKILDKLGIKGIKKIVIERRGDKVEVFLLEDPADLPAARKVLTGGVSPTPVTPIIKG